MKITVDILYMDIKHAHFVKEISIIFRWYILIIDVRLEKQNDLYLT